MAELELINCSRFWKGLERVSTSCKKHTPGVSTRRS